MHPLLKKILDPPLQPSLSFEEIHFGVSLTIVTFELYIVKESSFVEAQKGIGRVSPISQFFPLLLPSFAKTASFLLLVARKFKVR